MIARRAVRDAVTEMPNEMAIDNLNKSSEEPQEPIESLGFVVCVCVCVLLGVFFGVPTLRGRPAPDRIRFHGRINPNDAPVSSLVRLPGIGVSRASAIVAYRESLGPERDRPPFEDAADLQNVKGIGPKTVENIGPFLEFE